MNRPQNLLKVTVFFVSLLLPEAELHNPVIFAKCLPPLNGSGLYLFLGLYAVISSTI
jgi:hypothetical protein